MLHEKFFNYVTVSFVFFDFGYSTMALVISKFVVTLTILQQLMKKTKCRGL